MKISTKRVRPLPVGDLFRCDLFRASNLVKVFEQRDAWDEADRITTEVAAAAPDSSLAWELRAEVLQAMGRADAARLARGRAEANQ
jgi:hypothetical protein